MRRRKPLLTPSSSARYSAHLAEVLDLPASSPESGADGGASSSDASDQSGQSASGDDEQLAPLDDDVPIWMHLSFRKDAPSADKWQHGGGDSGKEERQERPRPEGTRPRKL